MEAVGFWPRGNEPCGRRRSGFGTPNGENSTPCISFLREPVTGRGFCILRARKMLPASDVR